MARAAAGESITITDRGRPVAMMVPLSASRIEALIAAARARPALRSISRLPRPVPAPGGRTLSDELEEMRRSERF